MTRRSVRWWKAITTEINVISKPYMYIYGIFHSQYNILSYDLLYHDNAIGVDAVTCTCTCMYRIYHSLKSTGIVTLSLLHTCHVHYPHRYNLTVVFKTVLRLQSPCTMSVVLVFSVQPTLSGYTGSQGLAWKKIKEPLSQILIQQLHILLIFTMPSFRKTIILMTKTFH